MNRFAKALLLGFALLTLAACGRAAPDAGEEGVIIRKPWIFGHGGVDPDPVKPGLKFVALSTDVLYVNMNPQAFDLKYDDIMSSDGIPLDFHATLQLQVTDSVMLVSKFGGGDVSVGRNSTGWYSTNIEPVENNYVRDAFKQHDMHSLAISATGTDAVEKEVRARLEAYIVQRGIPARVVNFTLGRVNPPMAIKTQRIKTAEEQQRQQTELQTKIAEDNRKSAETSRAQADDAYRQAMQLSPEQFVELQRIGMMRDVCSSGKCTFVVGNATALVGKP